MRNFKNKVVVITGAGSGIGRALAMEFGQLGSLLALNDYDPEGLKATQQLLVKNGVKNIYTQAFDVANKEAMDDFAQQTKNSFGNAHVVINNAGIAGNNTPAYNSSIEDYRKIMDINFFGVVHGCQAFLPQMVEHNEGVLVNVSSVFGLMGVPNQSDYCASKFAVRGYTETLMAEFESSPINIHCVHPGGIATNIAKRYNDNGQRVAKKTLTTNPHDLAKFIIKGIRKQQPKIVYGNSSGLLWFGSNIVPQKLLNKMVWNQFSKMVDTKIYNSFLKKQQ